MTSTMNKTGLVICPETELKFKGPFDKVNVAHLRLTNMNDKPVLFKIKTTAPKKYCVRPNCGSVQPNETLKVMIALQPFDYDPNEKNKHKFMVQSLVAAEEGVEIEQAFYEASPDAVTEMKLRCVFEMPKEEPTATTAQVSKDSSALLSSSPGKRAAGGNGDDLVTTTGATSTTGGSGMSGASEQFRTTAELGSSPRSDAVQEDMDQLRQENLLLNEQILRLKMTIESAQTGRDSAASKSFQSNSYAPPPSSVMQLQQQQKTVFIVAGVMLALLGILIGKFVL